MKINRLHDSRFMRCAMGMALLCTAFFLCCATAYADTDFTVTEVQMQGTITSDSSLNVRSGPGREYDVVTKVGHDAVLLITGETDNGWYQVEIDGKTGYVSGEYVNAAELQTQETEELEKEAGEPEEGYRGLHQSPFVIKLAVIGAVIIVILVMLAVTLKGIRRDAYNDDEDDGEYDSDAEDDDDDGEYGEEAYEDEEYDEDEYDDGDEEDNGRTAAGRQALRRRHSAHRKADQEVTSGKASGKNSAQTKRKEYVLREEDYRVQIDPSFFEDREPIEQPAMVTGYLERKKIEEAQEKARAQEEAAGKQKELDEAMAKLSELQKEIERLKNQ